MSKSSTVPDSRNQSYRFSMNNPQTSNYDSGGLAGTVRPSYNIDDPLPSIYDFGQPAWKSGELNLNSVGTGQQPALPPSSDPSLWERLKSWGSNYGRDKDGKVNTEGSPLVRDATAIGGLGLGVASFLEQRKTAGLQREALRHDIDTAKEHRANRQALGASWNRAWGN